MEMTNDNLKTCINIPTDNCQQVYKRSKQSSNLNYACGPNTSTVVQTHARDEPLICSLVADSDQLFQETTKLFLKINELKEATVAVRQSRKKEFGGSAHSNINKKIA